MSPVEKLNILFSISSPHLPSVLLSCLTRFPLPCRLRPCVIVVIRSCQALIFFAPSYIFSLQIVPNVICKLVLFPYSIYNFQNECYVHFISIFVDTFFFCVCVCVCVCVILFSLIQCLKKNLLILFFCRIL